jgi:hypothetical protein
MCDAPRRYRRAYGSRFPGYPTDGRDHGRALPRMTNSLRILADGEIADDEVPREIAQATYKAALRQLDLKR